MNEFDITISLSWDPESNTWQFDHDVPRENEWASETVSQIAASAAVDADREGLRPYHLCEACHGKRWLIVEMDGDSSHDWIQRCDNCSYPGLDDDQAAELASKDTGRPLGYATPSCWADTPQYTQPYLVKEEVAV